VIAGYANHDPSALGQATGTTAAFVAGLGAYSYATRHDLSSLARGAFWAPLALIVFGIVLLFVSIPGGHIVYAVTGLTIFGVFILIDFHRLDPRYSLLHSVNGAAASSWDNGSCAFNSALDFTLGGRTVIAVGQKGNRVQIARNSGFG
jgi:FtsH-binding integral membrane protein